jgi:hypothetical protein
MHPHPFIGKRPGSLRHALSLSALAVVVCLAAASRNAGATEQRSQAAAQSPQVTADGYTLQRKDFRFGDFSGWLKRGGEWQIEGPVRHRGLRCGTYEIGMRFGIGNPGCTNVQWISGDEFVTSRSQCNEAEIHHAGNGITPALGEQFDAITCAERVIRCTGNCK